MNPASASVSQSARPRSVTAEDKGFARVLLYIMYIIGT